VRDRLHGLAAVTKTGQTIPLRKGARSPFEPAGLGRGSRGHGLPRKLGFGLVRYSGADLRLIVRVIAVLFAWKWLSIDFSALPRLVHGPALVNVSWPASWFVSPAQSALLDHEWTVKVAQIGGALATLAAAVFLRRSLMVVGVVLILALMFAAAPYNGPIYDAEQPIVLLAIVAFWPRSWNVFRGDATATRGATLLGVALATYIGGGYLLAGLSKLEFDHLWFEHVHLDLLYPAMTVWHSATLPGLLDHSAVFLHDVFAAHQLLAEIAAVITLCCELLWSLAIVNRFARYVLPPAMVGAHLMIFLSSGILFGMMALVGLVVIWTPLVRETILRRRPIRAAAPQRDVSVPWRFVVPVMAGAAFLLAVPAYDQTSYHAPLANYRTFGWSYGTIAQPNIEYRFGIRDDRTGRLEPFPMNYGGFLDYRMLPAPGGLIAAYIGADKATKAAYANLLLQYVNGIRPYNSKGWLLGPLAFPNHVVAVADRMSTKRFTRIYLIEDRFIYKGGRLRDSGWVNRGLFVRQRAGRFAWTGS